MQGFCGRYAGTSPRRSFTLPEVCRSIPQITLSSVDLPLPLPPMTAYISPGNIRSDAPRRTSGAFLPQPAHSSLTETSGSPEGAYCFPAFCACSVRYSRQTALLLPSRMDTGEAPLPPAARNTRCEAVSAFSIG